MTGCGDTSTRTFPCLDVQWAAALGARPTACPLSGGTDLDEGPPSLLRAQYEMDQGRIVTALGHYADALADRSGTPSDEWEIRALAATGYIHALTERPGAAAEIVERLEQAGGPLKGLAATAGRLVAVWSRAAAGEHSEAAGLAIEAADRARSDGDYGTEVLMVHQAVRLGSPGHASRLTALTEQHVCRYTRLAAAHARGYDQRDGTALGTVASCFLAAGLMIEALDARAQAVTVLRAQGAIASAWETFSLAHSERRACEGATTPAWLAARMPLPLTDSELRFANLAAQGFVFAAIARRMEIELAQVHELQRAVFTKLRVTDRQGLATVLSATTDDTLRDPT